MIESSDCIGSVLGLGMISSADETMMSTILQHFVTLIHSKCRLEVKQAILRSFEFFSIRNSSVAQSHINKVFDCVSNCLDDYTVDFRGDVGSWIRLAAISCSQILLRDFSQLIESEKIRSWLLKMVRIGAEPLDKTRKESAECLKNTCLLIESLLSRSSSKVLLRGDEIWLETKTGFRHWVKLLEDFDLSQAVLQGFVMSIGGVSDSISEQASDALTQFCQETRFMPIPTLLKCLFSDEKRFRVPTLVTCYVCLCAKLCTPADVEVLFRKMECLTSSQFHVQKTLIKM